METKEIIEFFNKFPGVKAEAVSTTSIKLTSVYFMGEISYDSVKGTLNIDKLGRSVTQTVFELEEYQMKYEMGGITPFMLMTTLFDDRMLTPLLLDSRFKSEF